MGKSVGTNVQGFKDQEECDEEFLDWIPAELAGDDAEMARMQERTVAAEELLRPHRAASNSEPSLSPSPSAPPSPSTPSPATPSSVGDDFTLRVAETQYENTTRQNEDSTPGGEASTEAAPQIDTVIVD